MHVAEPPILRAMTRFWRAVTFQKVERVGPTEAVVFIFGYLIMLVLAGALLARFVAAVIRVFGAG